MDAGEDCSLGLIQMVDNGITPEMTQMVMADDVRTPGMIQMVGIDGLTADRTIADRYKQPPTDQLRHEFEQMVVRTSD